MNPVQVVHDPSDLSALPLFCVHIHHHRGQDVLGRTQRSQHQRVLQVVRFLRRVFRPYCVRHAVLLAGLTIYNYVLLENKNKLIISATQRDL